MPCCRGLNHEMSLAPSPVDGVGHIDTALNRPVQQLDELADSLSAMCRQHADDFAVTAGGCEQKSMPTGDLVSDLVETTAYHDLPALAVRRAHKPARG